jgi:hypothetical protein
MLIHDTTLTPALARWLRESHDDGEPELVIRRAGWGHSPPHSVLRADGSEVSDTERTEITARLAAHAAEPLR